MTRTYPLEITLEDAAEETVDQIAGEIEEAMENIRKYREAGFVPLTHWTKRLAFECGLKQHCADIIRFSHGASSSKKVYRSVFIPGLHDVAAIFEKNS